MARDNNITNEIRKESKRTVLTITEFKNTKTKKDTKGKGNQIL